MIGMWQKAKQWFQEWGAIVTAFTAVSGVVVLMVGFVSDTFDQRVITALSDRKKADFVNILHATLESDQRLKMLEHNVAGLIDMIDSGYTYTFIMDDAKTNDSHEFKFFADLKRQKVICYVLGKEKIFRVGEDITVRVDGGPLKVAGEAFEGELRGLDITEPLNEHQDDNIHTIRIEDVKNSPKAPENKLYAGSLLILVQNFLNIGNQ